METNAMVVPTVVVFPIVEAIADWKAHSLTSLIT